MKNTAIISGTFDPITSGHMDIIKKASKLFEKVIIAVCDNAEKKCMFSKDTRLKAVKISVQNLTNVSVELLKNETLADFTKKHDGVIVRGIRNGVDAEYEISLAEINKQIAGVDSIIIPSTPELSYVSSTFVRELIKYEKTLGNHVPSNVENLLK